MILTSGDIEVDESLYEVRRGAGPIRVQPRVFDLLRCLMRHAPHVVTRSELRSEVWHGANVCPAATARAVSVCRRALGDDETSQRLIQTVRGRGYRFAGNVRFDGAGAPEALRIGGRASGAPSSRAVVLDGDRELLERVVAYASRYGVEVRSLGSGENSHNGKPRNDTHRATDGRSWRGQSCAALVEKEWER